DAGASSSALKRNREFAQRVDGFIETNRELEVDVATHGAERDPDWSGRWGLTKVHDCGARCRARHATRRVSSRLHPRGSGAGVAARCAAQGAGAEAIFTPQPSAASTRLGSSHGTEPDLGWRLRAPFGIEPEVSEQIP